MGTPQSPHTPQNRIPGEQKIGQKDYNLVRRPLIKILRPLFTFQLLIFTNNSLVPYTSPGATEWHV